MADGWAGTDGGTECGPSAQTAAGVLARPPLGVTANGSLGGRMAADNNHRTNPLSSVDALADGNHAGVRKRISDLISGLPPKAVRDLLEYTTAKTNGGADPSLDIVKGILVDFLNRRRPNRAQRLFTELFEPVLISDPALLRHNRYVPGVYQRFDIGALWGELSRDAFPGLAETAQARVDDLARAMLVEDALKSPDLRRMQADMRCAALEHLEKLRKSRSALGKFMTAVNEARTAAGSIAGGGNADAARDTLPPLDRKFLDDVEEWLSFVEISGAVIKAKLPSIAYGQDQAQTRTRRLEMLVKSTDELRTKLAEVSDGTRHYLILPLTAINVKQHYLLIAGLIRDYCSDHVELERLSEALTGHFAATCTDLRLALEAVLALDARSGTPPMMVPDKSRKDIDRRLDRMTRALSAIVASGLLEDQMAERVFSHYWRELTRYLSNRLAPAVQARLRQGMKWGTSVPPDRDDIGWLTRFLLRWHDAASEAAQESVFFETWREENLTSVRKALASLKSVPEDELADGIDYLIRLQHITALFKVQLPTYFAVSSTHLAQVVVGSLRDEAEITGDRRLLLRGFIKLAKEEVARTQGWPNPTLVEVLELAKARDLLV